MSTPAPAPETILPNPFLKRFENADGSWEQFIWDEEGDGWLPHSSSSDPSKIRESETSSTTKRVSPG